MGNRNKIKRESNITKFPGKSGQHAYLKTALRGLCDDLTASFDEMIHSKQKALNWAIDQIPVILEDAGVSNVHFEPADGLLPFLMAGFVPAFEEEDEEDLQEDDFGGAYPCFSADGNGPDGVNRYDLILLVDGVDDEEPAEEGEHRIDMVLSRENADGSMEMFDGEEWMDMSDMFGMEGDEDEDDDVSYDVPFSLSDFDLT